MGTEFSKRFISISFHASRDVRIFFEVKTQGQGGGFGDADAGGGDGGAVAAEKSCARGIFGDEERGFNIAEVGAVLRVVDVHGGAEFAGAVGEEQGILHGTVGLHEIEAERGLDGADENRLSNAHRAANGVHAPMVAVNEIDISKSRRAEHDAVAGSFAAKGMRGGIVAEVGFGFDDDDGAQAGQGFADEEMAEEARGDGVGRGVVEWAC